MRRATEVMKIVRALLNGESIDHQGEHYQLKLDPPRMTTISGKCPPFYFGGLSHEARECAAEACDVYLMWPDTMDKVRENIADLTARAAKYGRTLKFGYRVHVIVRETEDEARAYADRLLSKLDDEKGRAIREASRSTRRTTASSGRPNCAARRTATASSRTTCGPASAARVRAAVRRSSAPPTRSSPSCAPIRPRGSRRSSSRAIRTSTSATCSPATCCRISSTVP